MQTFIADLHIHSRFSRATSKALTPRLLAAWARAKGVDVLGTGDFTHPVWLDELEATLTPHQDSGLYRLKDDRGLARELPELDGAPLPGRTLFMLQAEISSIYKRGGKVRKVHNLVFVPDFETARALNRKLAAIGNLASDGRPILGLDSRNLLEIVLELHPQAFLVPAHIWTPWFSLFGSKSGFDSVEECFGDLAPHIFALETGLSSDPEMNWRISALDRYALISNSDAHSGEKLARECNLFQGEPDYAGIFQALQRESLSHTFLGTVEFFPEEGKYHLDGHRACGVKFDPTVQTFPEDRCPICGKPLTVGVLHRVMELADRQAPAQPAFQPGFTSLFPLSECIADVLGAGPSTKKVKQLYATTLQRLGPELHVLRDAPLEDVRRVNTVLAEALDRMRRGQVIRQAGYDGEFGVIRVFSEEERAARKQGGRLSPAPRRKRDASASRTDPVDPADPDPGEAAVIPPPASPAGLNPSQQAAVQAGPGPVLVVAGPGAGKTRTLLARCLALLEAGRPARHLLLVTFTRKAAAEIEERLLNTLGDSQALPRTDTLHALAYDAWSTSHAGNPPTIMDEPAARRLFRESAQAARPSLPAREADPLYNACQLARERLERLDQWEDILLQYDHRKKHLNLADYTDLLEFWLQSMEHGLWQRPWTHVLVDEVQDLTPLQLHCLARLMPAEGDGLFLIGDPDQSIYGFRGAAPEVQETLTHHWPLLQTLLLEENYRALPAILEVAMAVFPPEDFLMRPIIRPVRQGDACIRLFEAPTAAAEVQWMAQQMRQLLGATSHTLQDAAGGSLAGTGLAGSLAPGDMAVLVRLSTLAAPLRAALAEAGLPVDAAEAERFWEESRTACILRSVRAMLGLENEDIEGDDSTHTPSLIPETLLTRGPAALPKTLAATAPFDAAYWTSPQFRELAAVFAAQGSWQAVCNWLALQTEAEQVRARSEAVRIMTMHAAKGLEFRAVFLPALEDGLVPFAGPGLLSGALPPGNLRQARQGRQGPDLEEERRLFYVACTRARDALFLSRAGRRRLYGRELRLPPSRFLSAATSHPACRRSALLEKVRHKETTLSLLG
ncbi:UvrD-helicase domain-containing protein [Megalodesulfovibrio gigas]|uniref:Putative UvrD/REP helicase n=1 Tax=Megalodesulfovibrio gigas (strain ATCC 19364 / DSM 1382 / NCIMB 9332 / VKM B-1759) TaxID=1121448 RepID=T2G879_MEGG1|nr:UvrD-helicase domain-containing protein [Megalodesulfovibrio gigas]AGW12493.1 putative UvrD/REP helicase [Megalodesulfovibrio gigas DSM 1382 = ATCC 19364]